MARAYIETSIPSYYTARPSRDLMHLANQQATRDWWDSGHSGFELVTSLETIDEAVRGDPVKAKERLQMLKDLPLLVITPEVQKIARE